MATQSQKFEIDEATEALKAHIEDSLADTILIEPQLQVIHHPTKQMKQGWYIAYQTARYEPERVFYLGATLKAVKKSFELWFKRWKVVR
jgi:hypothetical protein